MTLWWLALAGILVLLAVPAQLSWMAGRVDRLHIRVEVARSTLEVQLARRTAVALEVATSGLVDPATALLLADAAHRARTRGLSGEGPTEGEREPAGSPGGREAAESDLTQALEAAFPDPDPVRQLAERPGAAELLAELGAAARRVELARRFYNDTVATTRALRGRRLVRWFRLAGRAAMPDTVEIDDTPPPGLAA